MDLVTDLDDVLLILRWMCTSEGFLIKTSIILFGTSYLNWKVNLTSELFNINQICIHKHTSNKLHDPLHSGVGFLRHEAFFFVLGWIVFNFHLSFFHSFFLFLLSISVIANHTLNTITFALLKSLPFVGQSLILICFTLSSHPYPPSCSYLISGLDINALAQGVPLYVKLVLDS